MDTPERNQIGTSISKFEDSPVFSYINNLSPIKPVKSVHITQTFNSLSFSSPPSVFTSPHVSFHKESRFLKGHNFLDSSKSKVSSDDGNKDCTNEQAITNAGHLYNDSNDLRQCTDSAVSIEDASVEAPCEHTEFAIELPQTLKYDCGSPDCHPTPCCDNETVSVLILPGNSASVVAYAQDACENNPTEGEVQLQEISQVEPKAEGAGCDWESLISNDTDLLIFNSPNEPEAFKGLIYKSLDSTPEFYNFPPQLLQSSNNVQNMQIVELVSSSSQRETEDHYQPGAASDQLEVDKTQHNHANIALLADNPNEKMDNEPASTLHRGMRRRCLDFEMAGHQRKNPADGSSSGSCMSQSGKKIADNDKHLLTIKRSGESQRCILPGIGLHLNALAKTSKDYKNVKPETLSSGEQINLSSSSSSLHLPTTSQEHQHPLSISASSERDMDLAQDGLQLAEDGSQASAYLVSEEFNQNSPKKKRRKLEPAGEIEACKRCNCKKSKCLKLYCECFAAGVYCIEPCSCQDCFNKPIHEDTVIATRKQIESRNPLAFAPKVIRSLDSVPEIGEESNKTPASSRHKRGCNCKKSSCLKKYCECYQGGVGCSIGCRCEGCKNAFGRKDGSAPIGIEAEPGEETESCEKSVVDKALQKTKIQNKEVDPDSAFPATPLRFSRQLVPLSFSSKGKPPRSSSFLTTISSSGLYTSQKLGKPTILRSQKFEKPSQSVPDDEVPEILHDNASPIVKTSPNSKRVSSPQCDFGASPSRRSSRKLILQSIPSFPSLTPHH
ncbi:protein tesmin/TSO1-like CXC 2 [Quillaja saponaria]|uniref:Protein tesmin/TSO1-like CXC 2 n=1 Tax=Quillaja saponaria TaxID=32244 RepID=A0AAD7QFN3_QUISA|nr:protein tesmin/TSO1-like CXC 2 [Quillaja saponaria]